MWLHWQGRELTAFAFRFHAVYQVTHYTHPVLPTRGRVSNVTLYHEVPNFLFLFINFR